MEQFAEKLMTLRGSQTNTSLPSAIFGTLPQTSASLSNSTPQFRVGMWPAISTTDPLLAMGLMTALAALLEQYTQITVYRLFAKLIGNPSEYKWDISQSQFEFEDWKPEALDDNVGIWGQLNREGELWSFAVEVENDLSSSEDGRIITRQTNNFNGLVNLLPEIAEEIAADLGIDARTPLDLYATGEIRDDEQVKLLLVDWFHWELHLLLKLWGRGDSTSEPYSRLASNDEWRFTSDFGVWALAHAFSRTMLPGFANVQAELPLLDELLRPFKAHPLATAILSRNLYNVGQPRHAVDLLEQSVTIYPDSPRLWILLADFYRRSGDFIKAVDTYQRAIEVEAVSVPLYVNYAQLLPLMEAAEYEVEEFILIEPDQLSENYMSWEAVEAYEVALKLDVESPVSLLAAQTLLLIEVAEKEADITRLWRTFQTLVRYDQEGEAVRQVVESFYNMEDIENGLDILEDAVEQNPDRPDLRMNLALAYIVADEREYALSELEQAYELVVDAQAQGEIERLILVAQNATFETAMGEISDKINAGSPPNADELEFLEQAMEQAPQYLDPYLLLGKGYILRGDMAEALETLLEAQKRFSTDPDILESLAGVLWDTQEYETAFGYLQKGLNAYPQHVPLLARMGQYLFEDDDWEGAKLYLARAEAIEPKNPVLVRVRSFISKELSEEDGSF
jgi:tetratricopeptide (TPR) repeat protein